MAMKCLQNFGSCMFASSPFSHELSCLPSMYRPFAISSPPRPLLLPLAPPCPCAPFTPNFPPGILFLVVQRRDSLAMYNNLVFRCFDECSKVSVLPIAQSEDGYVKRHDNASILFAWGEHGQRGGAVIATGKSRVANAEPSHRDGMTQVLVYGVSPEVEIFLFHSRGKPRWSEPRAIVDCLCMTIRASSFFFPELPQQATRRRGDEVHQRLRGEVHQAHQQSGAAISGHPAAESQGRGSGRGTTLM